MEINGKTKVCGLIGNPVEHSISPLIHNTVSQMCKINMAYVTFKVLKDDIEAALEGASALGILGMNVTVPHKQAVIPYLKDCEPLAAAIGAVNTLVAVDGGYKGYNTDIIGFRRSLIDENVEIKDKTVVMLGAGGASRAIAFLLAGEGAGRIYILNRSLDKARDVAQAVNAYNGRDVVVPMPIADYAAIAEDGFICVQTTSVGLYPNVGDAVITDPAFYGRISTAMDIIYNPAQTRFMKLSEEGGAVSHNGLKMLLYQGIAAYELWNKIEVPKDVIDSVYNKMKEVLNTND